MVSFEPSPSDRTNAIVALKFYEAIFGGNWDVVETCIDSDLIVEEAMGLPYGGVYHGLAGLKEIFGNLSKYWGEMNIELNNITAGNGCTVGLLTFTGCAKSTGRHVSLRLAEVTEFKNNRMARISPFYWDTKAMSDALGTS